MKLVCEVMVQNVLPALRAVIARDLVKVHGMSQTEAAQSLGISQPAVSQYVRKLRGEDKQLLENSAVYPKIQKLCSDIAGKKYSHEKLAEEFCGICKLLNDKGLMSKFGKYHVPDSCPPLGL